MDKESKQFGCLTIVLLVVLLFQGCTHSVAIAALRGALLRFVQTVGGE